MATDFSLDVQRDGRRFEAEALLDLPASAATVWQTITDYAALPNFMPGIRACRVLERRDDGPAAETLRVEQRGEFRFLLFAQPMTVMLEIRHQGQRVAEARASSFELGLLRRRVIDVFEGRYEILPVKAGRRAGPRVQLRYTALIGLHLPPPPAIGSVAVRQNLAAQLQALQAEILRRQAEPA